MASNALICLLFISQVTCQNDIVGKLTVGYQGWFIAEGDGSPANRWMRWTNSGEPRPNNTNIELFPDIRDYKHLYATGFSNLANGQAARLFSSWDQDTVDLHFQWMQDNNMDVAALRRIAYDVMFASSTRGIHNGIVQRVMAAAEAYKRKFYIQWDTTNWTRFNLEMFADLDYNLRPLNIFNSTAYAHQNGLPVIGVFGLGFTTHPGEAPIAHALVQKLQSLGFYVIGGVPTYWRQETNDSKQNFRPAYMSLDMLQPWTVSQFATVSDAKNYAELLRLDAEMLKRFNVEYQPVVFPGYSIANMRNGTRNQIPRMHGDFLWQQFVNIRTLGIKSAFVATFDDFDDGTAIAKAAENQTMVPTNQYFLTLDADGTRVSSDFYLRLVADGNRMMQEQIPLQQQYPTKHVPSK